MRHASRHCRVIVRVMLRAAFTVVLSLGATGAQSAGAATASAATFRQFPCDSYLVRDSADARLIRSLEGQMRLGYEFELFPTRIKYLIPYVDREALMQSLVRKLGSEAKFAARLRESWGRYPTTALESTELKRVYQSVTRRRWDPARSPKAMVAKIPFDRWPDELVAQLIIDAKIADSVRWSTSAPATLRAFEWGDDWPSVEFRTRPDVQNAVTPFDSMRLMVQLTGLHQTFYVTTLADDVTEGAEYHYHTSFPGNALYGERLAARASAFNRLYLLENMGLGPDHNPALTIKYESFRRKVTKRGLVRVPGPQRLESRWHYADPETELANLIRYVQMDDAEFARAIRAREEALIHNGTHIIRRLQRLKPKILENSFTDWADDPFFQAEINAAGAEH